MNNSKVRDVGFDLIRSASAIWIVCVWHLLAYAEPGINYVIAPVSFCAELALACFMFISGFFLGQKSISNKREVWEFYKKRFWRFYILYFIAALILLAGGILAGKMWFQTPLSLMSTIIGVSSFIDPTVGTIWFMSMLMMFYILTPLILYGNDGGKKRLWVSVIIYLLFLALYFILPSADVRLLRFFPLYALGLLVNKTTIGYLKKSCLAAIIALVACTVLTAFPFSFSNEHLSIIVSNLIYVLKFFSAIIFLIWCVDKINLSGGDKFCSCIEFVSYLSLSLYLFHRPVYQVLTMVINGLHSKGIINFGPNLWVLYFVYVPIVIVVSFFIQKIYDKFLNKIR